MTADARLSAVPVPGAPPLVVAPSRTRREEIATTLTFLTVNGSIAVGGWLLLHLLIDRGLAPGVANAVQAVITLQVNFTAGLLLTWRWQTAGTRVGLGRRWTAFHAGRGTVLLVNLAVFPLLSAGIGVTPAFVALLGLGAVAHYALDRWWVFRRLAQAGSPA